MFMHSGVLNMDDAEKVCNKIQEHHANWKKIGEALGINSDKLNDIDRKHKSTEHCLAKLCLLYTSDAADE